MFNKVTTRAIILVMLTVVSGAQAKKSAASFGSAPTLALAYFDNIPSQSFDGYLKSIRPGRTTPERKARLIGIFPKQDIVGLSEKGGQNLLRSNWCFGTMTATRWLI
jgi:hypothetical protein